MKDRRRVTAGFGRASSKRHSAYSSWFSLFAFLCFALFAAISYSTFRVFTRLPIWKTSAINALASDHPFLRRGPATSKRDSRKHQPFEIEETRSSSFSDSPVPSLNPTLFASTTTSRSRSLPLP